MALLQKDTMLYLHIILGLAVIIASLYIIFLLKGKESKLVRQLAFVTAAVSWVQLLPSAATYLIFYPATKAVIKAGAWPWAHSIVMETKEHWGLLIPVFTTVAAGLVLQGKVKESRKWWWLVVALAVAIGVLGRLVKMGALAK